ncbi:MAG: hypothetical protein NC918_06920 [Candidatus Omnitrophica bacterium]|nr:hypothetical protein [Candidatus Omnitrophota bacterium]
MLRSFKKRVAIVVPIYKENLTAEEKISLKHLRYFLSKYDKFLVVPKRFYVSEEYVDFSIKRFPEKYFTGKENYSKLLVSSRFYKEFLDYEYILIYQLDALVFSDKLLEWCDKGYDYVGAPWYKEEVMLAIGWKLQKDDVGNGGFSLRKVSSCLKVLKIYNSPFNTFKRK